MEWSFGVSWIDVDLLLILDDDNALTLFLTELSTVEFELELDVCNWFDFELSENVAFGFWNEWIVSTFN